MLENINLAFQGVWSHKLRSFLTMLGIIIGIAAIITIVSTIKGTNEQIKQNLIGAGNNVVDVTLTQDSNQMDFSYDSVPDGVSMITPEMRDEIDKLDKVKEASLYYSRSWADGVYVGNSSFNGNIYGGDIHFLSVEGYVVNYGRGFIDSDFETCRKVALIDANTAQSMFQGLNPIGGTIEIMGEPFVVVGVVSQNSTSAPVINSLNDYYMYSGNTSGTLIIPNTCWPIIYRYDEPSSVAVRATSTNDMTEAGNNVAQYLNDNVVSTDKCKYQAKDLLQQAADLQSLSETTNKQLIWIAAISLVVGGIGVMNIMLVSVTDGAYPRDRPEDRHRRTAEPHPLAVPDGGGGADQSGRYSGRGLRYRPCLYAQLRDGNTGGHQCGRLRHCRGLLHGDRRGVRIDARRKGLQAEPHRGIAKRIKTHRPHCSIRSGGGFLLLKQWPFALTVGRKWSKMCIR